MRKLSECRLLLVDDARANLDILIANLKSDYLLSIAPSGQIALQVAARTPPDLVLLDVVMPGMDGYDVCRQLRARPETADVPIVFLTTLEHPASKTHAFNVGATDFLQKPFDIPALKARVRELLVSSGRADAPDP
jgi:DNA-binding response OmpR family regulator